MTHSLLWSADQAPSGPPICLISAPTFSLSFALLQPLKPSFSLKLLQALDLPFLLPEMPFPQLIRVRYLSIWVLTSMSSQRFSLTIPSMVALPTLLLFYFYFILIIYFNYLIVFNYLIINDLLFNI